MPKTPNEEIKPFCPLCTKSHKLREVEHPGYPFRDFRCDETGCIVEFSRNLKLEKEEKPPLVIDPVHQKFLNDHAIEQSIEWAKGD